MEEQLVESTECSATHYNQCIKCYWFETCSKKYSKPSDFNWLFLILVLICLGGLGYLLFLGLRLCAIL